METDVATPSDFLGIFTVATLPAAGAGNKSMTCFVTDMNGGTLMVSNGTSWSTVTTKRILTFDGTTDGSGNFSATFTPAFAAIPHINPVCYPPADSTTRVRVTAASTGGFTVKTEKNNTVTVLSLDVLALGTANVPSVPVRVVVIES